MKKRWTICFEVRWIVPAIVLLWISYGINTMSLALKTSNIWLLFMDLPIWAAGFICAMRSMKVAKL